VSKVRKNSIAYTLGLTILEKQ